MSFKLMFIHMFTRIYYIVYWRECHGIINIIITWNYQVNVIICNQVDLPTYVYVCVCMQVDMHYTMYILTDCPSEPRPLGWQLGQYIRVSIIANLLTGNTRLGLYVENCSVRAMYHAGEPSVNETIEKYTNRPSIITRVKYLHKLIIFC